MKRKTIKAAELAICARASKLYQAINPDHYERVEIDIPDSVNIAVYQGLNCYYAISDVGLAKSLIAQGSRRKIAVSIVPKNDDSVRTAAIFSEISRPLDVYQFGVKYRKTLYQRLNQLRKSDVDTYQFYFPDMPRARDIKDFLKLTDSQTRPPRDVVTGLTTVKEGLSL